MRSALPHRAVWEAGVPLKVDFFGQPHLPFKETDVELISTLVIKSLKTFRSFPKIILTHLWIMTARTTLITWLSQVFFTAGHCARLSFWVSTCYIMNTIGSQCSVLCPHSWHDKPSLSQLQRKVFLIYFVVNAWLVWSSEYKLRLGCIFNYITSKGASNIVFQSRVLVIWWTMWLVPRCRSCDFASILLCCLADILEKIRYYFNLLVSKRSSILFLLEVRLYFWPF